jgi:hypothetical protein
VPSPTPRLFAGTARLSGAVLLQTWLLLPHSAGATLSPSARCSIDKLHAMAKAAHALLQCDSNAARKGGASDPQCSSKATDSLTTAFSAADESAAKAGGSCTHVGDGPARLATIEAYADAIVALLRPAQTASRGTAAKLDATAVFVASQFVDQAKLVQALYSKRPGEALAKVTAKIDASNQELLQQFSKVDAKGTSLTKSDGPSILRQTLPTSLNTGFGFDAYCIYRCAVDISDPDSTSPWQEIPRPNGSPPGWCQDHTPGQCSYVTQGDEITGNCVVLYPCDRHQGDDCSRLGVCRPDVTSPTTGDCVPNPKADDTPCAADDGNPCTVSQCRSGACDTSISKEDGSACGDNDPNFCYEQCVGGNCVSMTRQCPDTDGFSCTAEICNFGACLPSVPDDRLCTAVDACTPAHCAPGAAGSGASGCVSTSACDASGETCDLETQMCEPVSTTTTVTTTTAPRPTTTLPDRCVCVCDYSSGGGKACQAVWSYDCAVNEAEECAVWSAPDYSCNLIDCGPPPCSSVCP